MAAVQRGIGLAALVAATVSFGLVFSSFGSGTAAAESGEGARTGEAAHAAIAAAAEESEELRFLVQDPTEPITGETLLRLLHMPGAFRSASVAIDTVAGAAADDSLRRQRSLTALDGIAHSLEEQVDALVSSVPGSRQHRDARAAVVVSLGAGRSELASASEAVHTWSDSLRRNRLQESAAAIDQSLHLLSLQALAAAVAVVTAAVGVWLIVTGSSKMDREPLPSGG